MRVEQFLLLVTRPCDHLVKARTRARQRKETHMPKGKMIVYTNSISPERDAGVQRVVRQRARS